jgi:hypothetical protein
MISRERWEFELGANQGGLTLGAGVPKPNLGGRHRADRLSMHTRRSLQFGASSCAWKAILGLLS